MYVCSCRAVSDREINMCIAAGARTVEDLARQCGAGTQCRGCWPTLERMLRERPIVLGEEAKA